MKTLSPGNCPYCDSQRGIGSPWGMTPEGMARLKEDHDAGHPSHTRKDNITQVLSPRYKDAISQFSLLLEHIAKEIEEEKIDAVIAKNGRLEDQIGEINEKLKHRDSFNEALSLAVEKIRNYIKE